MPDPRTQPEQAQDFFPKDLSPEEQELVRSYEQLRRQGEEASRARVGNTELNLAFLSGNQWVQYQYPSGLMEVENELDEVRSTDNRITATYLRWMGMLRATDPAIDVYEGGIDLSDAEAAKAATLLCDFWKANNGWAAARKEQASWMLVGSVGYVAPVWQTFPFAAKKRRKVNTLLDEPTRIGNKLSYLVEVDHLEARGDIAWRFYNPLQTYLYPLDATRWQDVSRIMVVTLESADWLREHADRPVADYKPTGRNPVWEEAMSRVNRYVSAEFGLAHQPEAGARYLVMRIWENPTTAHPRGRYLEIAGNRILVDQELPYLDEAQEIDPLNADNLWMGVVPQFAAHMPSKLYPDAPVTMARAGQININEIATDAKQARIAGRNNKLLIAAGSIDMDAWCDERAEIIEVNPDTGFTPQFAQSPGLAGLEADRAAAEYSYTEMTGQTEASRGQNPTYVRSAEHFSLANNQSQQVTHLMHEAAEWSFEKQARLAMAIAKRRYSLDDIIRIVGKDRTMYAVSFGSSCVRTDLRVEQGSGMSRNHYWRQQRITEAFQYGLFDPGKVSPEGRRLYLEQMELGTTQSMADEDKQWQKQIEECVRMAVWMEARGVDLADDHDIHIAAMKSFMSRREYWDKLPLSLKANMQVHLQDHIHARAAQLDPSSTVPTEPIAGLGQPAAAQPQPAPEMMQ